MAGAVIPAYTHAAPLKTEPYSVALELRGAKSLSEYFDILNKYKYEESVEALVLNNSRGKLFGLIQTPEDVNTCIRALFSNRSARFALDFAEQFSKSEARKRWKAPGELLLYLRMLWGGLKAHAGAREAEVRKHFDSFIKSQFKEEFNASNSRLGQRFEFETLTLKPGVEFKQISDRYFYESKSPEDVVQILHEINARDLIKGWEATYSFSEITAKLDGRFFSKPGMNQQLSNLKVEVRRQGMSPEREREIYRYFNQRRLARSTFETDYPKILQEAAEYFRAPFPDDLNVEKNMKHFMAWELVENFVSRKPTREQIGIFKKAVGLDEARYVRLLQAYHIKHSKISAELELEIRKKGLNDVDVEHELALIKQVCELTDSRESSDAIVRLLSRRLVAIHRDAWGFESIIKGKPWEKFPQIELSDATREYLLLEWISGGGGGVKIPQKLITPAVVDALNGRKRAWGVQTKGSYIELPKEVLLKFEVGDYTARPWSDDVGIFMADDQHGVWDVFAFSERGLKDPAIQKEFALFKLMHEREIPGADTAEFGSKQDWVKIPRLENYRIGAAHSNPELLPFIRMLAQRGIPLEQLTMQNLEWRNGKWLAVPDWFKNEKGKAQPSLSNLFGMIDRCSIKVVLKRELKLKAEQEKAQLRANNPQKE